jgi:hypothetical protein
MTEKIEQSEYIEVIEKRDDSSKPTDFIFEARGENFSEKVQNLANFISGKESNLLDEVLNLVIASVPPARSRDVEIDGLKAEIIMLTKQRDSYKERAYKLADQRPMMHDIESFRKYAQTASYSGYEEAEQEKAEAARKDAALEFLGGL